jgi:superfamily I DNA and/or RNA helicase
MTLFKRIGYIAEQETTTDIPFKLRTQHRMVRELAELSVTVFYREGIENVQFSVEVPDLSGIDSGNPLTFIDTPGPYEMRGDDGRSFFNVKETVVAASFVDRLYKAGVNAEKIAILSFYDGEITFAKRVFPKMCEAPQEYLNGLHIQTVDASEGKDFEIVILLCVRNKKGGNRGFMRRERLLVAVTRARLQLFIIGSLRMWKVMTEDGWGD